jgi:hypothetical protein
MMVALTPASRCTCPRPWAPDLETIGSDLVCQGVSHKSPRPVRYAAFVPLIRYSIRVTKPYRSAICIQRATNGIFLEVKEIRVFSRSSSLYGPARAMRQVGPPGPLIAAGSGWPERIQAIRRCFRQVRSGQYRAAIVIPGLPPAHTRTGSAVRRQVPGSGARRSSGAAVSSRSRASSAASATSVCTRACAAPRQKWGP